jgi:curved DNA-binding protein CbpA
MSTKDYLEKDYYKTLGVPKTAMAAEIKKAYHDLARKHHPDANKGNANAEERFKEITEANNVLSDEKQRKEYDEARFECIAPSCDPNTASGHGPACSDLGEPTRNASSAQGWYRDPYGLHEDRYFSQGRPTKLVRDGERECFDLPPDQPLPEAELIPAGQPGGEAADGSDLLRVDQPSGRYNHDKALTEVFGMAW